jgi:adenylate cyclase
MSETRKLAAILVADIVGHSRLAGADEDRTLSRLRGLRSDLIDPAIDANHGRIVKRTGDGSLIEFRSVGDAVRCAIEVQNGMAERNAGVPAERRIEFRVGVHLGDVVEEADDDLMGDGVNVAARWESIAKPGAICLSEQAYWQVKGRLDLAVSDLGPETDNGHPCASAWLGRRQRLAKDRECRNQKALAFLRLAECAPIRDVAWSSKK